MILCIVQSQDTSNLEAACKGVPFSLARNRAPVYNTHHCSICFRISCASYPFCNLLGRYYQPYTLHRTDQCNPSHSHLRSRAGSFGSSCSACSHSYLEVVAHNYLEVEVRNSMVGNCFDGDYPCFDDQRRTMKRRRSFGL